MSRLFCACLCVRERRVRKEKEVWIESTAVVENLYKDIIWLINYFHCLSKAQPPTPSETVKSEHALICRSILGMVTVGNILAQMVKNKVRPSDPVSKIMYKQFKKVLFLHWQHCVCFEFWWVFFCCCCCWNSFWVWRWIFFFKFLFSGMLHVHNPFNYCMWIKSNVSFGVKMASWWFEVNVLI